MANFVGSHFSKSEEGELCLSDSAVKPLDLLDLQSRPIIYEEHDFSFMPTSHLFA